MFNYSNPGEYDIPDHTKHTLEDYLLQGWEPGGFVTSMLAMDMERAVYAADTVNRHMIWSIARWIIEECPPMAWGSYDAVEAWCKDVDGRRSYWVHETEKKKIWKTLKEQNHA